VVRCGGEVRRDIHSRRGDLLDLFPATSRQEVMCSGNWRGMIEYGRVSRWRFRSDASSRDCRHRVWTVVRRSRYHTSVNAEMMENAFAYLDPVMNLYVRVGSIKVKLAESLFIRRLMASRQLDVELHLGRSHA